MRKQHLFYIDEDKFRKFKKICVNEDITISDYIQNLIEDEIKIKGEKDGYKTI